MHISEWVGQYFAAGVTVITRDGTNLDTMDLALLLLCADLLDDPASLQDSQRAPSSSLQKDDHSRARQGAGTWVRGPGLSHEGLAGRRHAVQLRHHLLSEKPHRFPYPGAGNPAASIKLQDALIHRGELLLQAL